MGRGTRATRAAAPDQEGPDALIARIDAWLADPELRHDVDEAARLLKAARGGLATAREVGRGRQFWDPSDHVV